MLANECSIGFEAIRNSIVKSVNGTRIRNLRQLAQVVDSCTEEFLRFEVGRSMLVVLETKKLKQATQQVQFTVEQHTAQYCIWALNSFSNPDTPNPALSLLSVALAPLFN